MTDIRKLYRSRNDRKLAGVCGGLAAYLNTDSTVIRVITAILFLAGTLGLWVYLVLWFIIPEER